MERDSSPRTAGPVADLENGARFRILVADDEEPVRRTVARCLEGAGHRVTTASDGLEAWMRFRETPFPILVTDIRMPGLSGIDLLERIRTDWPDTEVVLISGLNDAGLVIKALRCGATNFIEKPFTQEEFLQQMFPAFHRCALAIEAARLQQMVAELREKEEREQRMAALGRLLSGMAHQIHNPLTFVKGNAELLQRFVQSLQTTAREGQPLEPRIAGEMATLLQDLRHGVARIETMVETVRTFGARPPPELKELRLADLMAASFRVALAQKTEEVAASFSPPPQGILVAADEADMEGCLVNLLVNAFAAASCGGSSVLFYTREIPYPTVHFSGFVEVIVEDDGPGIPKDIIDDVFTPFFTTKTEGTGLGLSIAYEAAQRNGAQVEIESREGHGATLTVRFPFRWERGRRSQRGGN